MHGDDPESSGQAAPSFGLSRMLVAPGTWVVARMPGLALLASRASSRSVVDGLLTTCGDICRVDPQTPGLGLGRKLARYWLTVDDAAAAGVDFGVIAAAGDRLGVFLCGGVDVVVDDDAVLSGREASSWVDRLVAWPTRNVTIAPSGSRRDSLPAPTGEQWWDLRAGVVPGGALSLWVAAAAREDTSLDLRFPPRLVSLAEAVEEPDTPGPVLVEPISGAHEEREPLDVGVVASAPAVVVADGRDADGQPAPKPLAVTGTTTGPEVLGVLCAREHFNDPRAAFCAVCGIRMDNRSAVLVDGRRPVIGLLVLDDGKTVLLDSGYLIGRDPSSDDRVQAGDLRPLVLEDEQGTVSRIHAEIGFDGWDMYLLDRHSVNGTYVAAPGVGVWSPLAPGRREPLPPGSRVQIGTRTLVYESHHGLR